MLLSPGSLSYPMSIFSLQCPYLNLVAAAGPLLDPKAANENRLSLTCEVHNRASLLHSPPELTFLSSQQQGKAEGECSSVICLFLLLVNDWPDRK